VPLILTYLSTKERSEKKKAPSLLCATVLLSGRTGARRKRGGKEPSSRKGKGGGGPPSNSHHLSIFDSTARRVKRKAKEGGGKGKRPDYAAIPWPFLACSSSASFVRKKKKNLRKEEKERRRPRGPCTSLLPLSGPRPEKKEGEKKARLLGVACRPNQAHEKKEGRRGRSEPTMSTHALCSISTCAPRGREGEGEGGH